MKFFPHAYVAFAALLLFADRGALGAGRRAALLPPRALTAGALPKEIDEALRNLAGVPYPRVEPAQLEVSPRAHFADIARRHQMRAPLVEAIVKGTDAAKIFQELSRKGPDGMTDVERMEAGYVEPARLQRVWALLAALALHIEKAGDEAGNPSIYSASTSPLVRLLGIPITQAKSQFPSKYLGHSSVHLGRLNASFRDPVSTEEARAAIQRGGWTLADPASPGTKTEAAQRRLRAFLEAASAGNLDPEALSKLARTTSAAVFRYDVIKVPGADPYRSLGAAGQLTLESGAFHAYEVIKALAWANYADLLVLRLPRLKGMDVRKVAAILLPPGP